MTPGGSPGDPRLPPGFGVHHWSGGQPVGISAHPGVSQRLPGRTLEEKVQIWQGGNKSQPQPQQFYQAPVEESVTVLLLYMSLHQRIIGLELIQCGTIFLQQINIQHLLLKKQWHMKLQLVMEDIEKLLKIFIASLLPCLLIIFLHGKDKVH